MNPITDTTPQGLAAAFQFKTVYEFADAVIRPVYAQSEYRIADANWSQWWWAHPEVVLRFHALWQAYEAGRSQAPATHLEPFLRLCADYHLRVIMADQSVFSDCKKTDVPSIPLPAEPVQGAR